MGLSAFVSKGRSERNSSMPQYFGAWKYGQEHIDTKDKNALLDAYRSWAFICIKRNNTAFAQTPLKLYVAKTRKGTKTFGITRPITSQKRKYLESLSTITNLECVRKAVDIEEVTDHRFLDLMKNVNPFMNAFRLLEITNMHQDLTGDAYWFLRTDRLGLPAEIWIMPPEKMTIVPDKEKFISHYFHKIGFEQKRYEIADVVHFLYPHPKDPYYGLSPLGAVADMYNINQSMNKWENAIYTNNCRPEGFFSTEGELSDDEFKRTQKELNEVYAGIVNTGKSGLLTHGMKYEKLNWPPRELGFLRGREWTKKEIEAAFDQPAGLFDKDATYANSKAARYVWMKFGISPRHRRWEQKANEQILPLYDEKLFVAFDNCVPEDEEFLLKERVEHVKNGITLVNEERAKIGLEPLDGGDELRKPRQGFGTGEPTTEEMENFTGKVAQMTIEEIESAVNA